MVCGWEYMLNNIVDTVRVLILYMYGTTADSYFRPLEFPHALQQEAATVHQNTEMAWRPTYSGVVSVNGRAPVGHGAFRRASISYQLRRCWWLPYSYRLRKKRCLLRSSCKQASKQACCMQVDVATQQAWLEWTHESSDCKRFNLICAN